MKKLLLILILLIAGPALGQGYKTYNIETRYRSSNTMIWNQSKEEWDFFDNDDRQDFIVEWKLVIDAGAQTGTIIANNVSYDITSITNRKSKDGSTVVVFQVSTAVAGRKITFLLTEGKEGETFIGMYDFTKRTAYYFN